MSSLVVLHPIEAPLRAAPARLLHCNLTGMQFWELVPNPKRCLGGLDGWKLSCIEDHKHVQSHGLKSGDFDVHASVTISNSFVR